MWYSERQGQEQRGSGDPLAGTHSGPWEKILSLCNPSMAIWSVMLALAFSLEGEVDPMMKDIVSQVDATLKTVVGPSATISSPNSTSEELEWGDELEWGVRLDFTLEVTRASVFNWPTGEHDSWPSRHPIKAPADHIHDDLNDPHSPLKVSKAGELNAMAKRRAPFAEINASATALYAPFLERISRWVPEDKRATARIMLLVSGGIRAFSEAQQCPLWYALWGILEASPFRSGVVHLISIPSDRPFNARKCPDKEFQ